MYLFYLARREMAGSQATEACKLGFFPPAVPFASWPHLELFLALVECHLTDIVWVTASDGNSQSGLSGPVAFLLAPAGF